MPPKNNKKKKKKHGGKKTNASSAAPALTACVQCARQFQPDDSMIPCICTRVVYCSEDCQGRALNNSQNDSAHQCPGPPDVTIDIAERYRQSRSGADNTIPMSQEERRRFAEESRQTVSEPLVADVLRIYGLRAPESQTLMDPKQATVKDYAKLADQGSVAAAYLAGIRYKQRILGKMQNRRGLVVNNADDLGVLETDALAVRYLMKGAEAGHALSMQSLGDCYYTGQGVRKSLREAREWIWRAVLQQSAGASSMLDTKSVLINEHMAHATNFEAAREHLVPGQTISMCGPNLCSLFMALRNAFPADGTFPAFAGSVPTCTAGNRACEGTTGPVNIVGTDAFRETMKVLKAMERRGNDVWFTYGRRGVGKAATAQTYAEATRPLDAQLFVVPPRPACDDVLTVDEVHRWLQGFISHDQRDENSVLTVCPHSNDEALSGCPQCIEDAQERLAAVATGATAISLQEALESRGHLAIFRGRNGTIKSETFKDYGRGEVECTLAMLVAAKDFNRGYLPHPIFVAQDPNLFWPLILSHGSIRAALEFVAPHVDWEEKLGSVRAVPEQVPIVPDTEPGKIMRRCGNDVCLKLEPVRGDGKFKTCSRCKRREYCSADCAKADWILHKRECRAAAAGSASIAQPAIPEQREHAKDRGNEPLKVGEEVVVQGLSAQPQYNGCLGVIGGDIANGRFPVKLSRHGSKYIALKPGNILRLGVHVSSGGKKARKFKCYLHDAELCATCSLDFCILNHVSQLQFSSGEPLSKDGLERVTENIFATIQRDDRDEIIERIDQDFPMECGGLQDPAKRVLLRALIESKEEKSLLVEAAIVGYACFSARSCMVVRAYVIPHLEVAAGKL